ncbi:MAG TPA: ATP-binding cassette domain-containing protein [Candidatus Bathyarchaeota archaeon]|nr:ATP-binding cassette domain-containing protein [Candidatus Bathyarchaeota archaeon]
MLHRKPREIFRIVKIAKKYDRKTGLLHITVAYKTAVKTLTPRTVAVAEAFGLGIGDVKRHVLYDEFKIRLKPTDIVYVTGESGSGKSVLLKRLERLLKPETVNISDIKVDKRKPIIETLGENVEQAIKLLSKVGLNDAFLFLRSYNELSEGQKYRYRIARLMESKAQYWILDEFCSTLDRDTAKIVAFNLQKQARKLGKAVIAATTHTDLVEDLSPTIHIHKQFGKEVRTRYLVRNRNKPAQFCSLTRKTVIEEGTIEDYKALSSFHYRSSRLPPPRKIFKTTRKDKKKLCGVIVYSYPPLACFGRKTAFQLYGIPFNNSLEWINANLSTISRVILHPKYRGIGLGVKLVKETLTKAGTPYVETVAVMARYNPFFEKAGMRHIATQKADASCLSAAETLRTLGVETLFTASEKYTRKRLRALRRGEKKILLQALARIKNQRFRRALVGKPYVATEEFCRALEKADVAKLAHALRVLNILLQKKFYLFWRREV